MKALTKALLAAWCWFVLGVATCTGGDKPGQAGNDPSAVIPATGHIGSIQVGVTTMERLEDWLGKGRAFTGGHPRGAREWFLKQAGWYIYADGFDYNDAGRVMDSFEVSTRRFEVGAFDDTDRKTRRASVDASKLTFIGGVTPGMARSQVRALLARNGIKPKATRNVITWKEKGHARNSNATFSTWTATLTFRHDRLEDIRIECV
ncbi:MAG: hypothetical protein ACLQVX_19680 [Limisphaerales bacterium]